MSDTLRLSAGLYSPEECAARIEGRQAAARTRLAQITQANRLRLFTGIRTEQELANALRNVIEACDFPGNDYCQEFKGALVSILEDWSAVPTDLQESEPWKTEPRGEYDGATQNVRGRG